MIYLLYITLGLLPSFIWLVFYLRKDKHPEPNSMVLKVFIWGMLLAPLAVILELLLIWLLNPMTNPLSIVAGEVKNGFLAVILAATLVPAVIEEILKYSIAKAKVLKNSVFDEPTDAMLYCIIAGLGFAAVENLLPILDFPPLPLEKTVNIIILRFLGATLVHALASGIVGYWLALGLLNIKKRIRFVFIGLSIAIAFHSCYNYLVVTMPNYSLPGQKLILSITASLLIGTALSVSNGFRKLKKQQSVCKI